MEELGGLTHAVHPDEGQEWVAERIGAWVETHKKSVLTPMILSITAAEQPVSVATVAERISATTGCQITEGGLHLMVLRFFGAAGEGRACRCREVTEDGEPNAPCAWLLAPCRSSVGRWC